MRKRLFIVMLLAAALLSACGLDLGGEPDILDEYEIQSTPTPIPQPIQEGTTETETGAETGTGAETDDTAADSGTTEQQPDRTLGRQLFLATCVQCHGGEDGVGPGLFTTIADAGMRIEGMSASEYIEQSILEPGAYVLDGYENLMPSYEGQFTDFELESIVAFIAEAQGRPTADSLSGATPTPVAQVQGDMLSVQGRMIQGTEDGDEISAGFPVDLLVLNSSGVLVGEYSTDTDDDGGYLFENVARAPGNIYLIRSNYAGVPQGVQIGAISGIEPSLTQDMTVYERTSDASSVRVRWAQMLINFAPITEFGLEVWLSLEIENTGDRIVTTDEVAGTGWLVSVPIELPVGSFGIQPMQSQGSNRYQVDVVDNVPVVKDTWPVRPGQTHSIAVAYYLPYEDGAVIDQSFTYPVFDGVVLVPNDTVAFESDQFELEGDFRYRVQDGGFHIAELEPGEEINPERDFTLVMAHDLKAALDAGERVIFTLDGRPTRTLDVIAASPDAANVSKGDSNDNLLPLALFVVGLSILALSGVLWWRQRATLSADQVGAVNEAGVDNWQPPRASAGKEALMAAIVELDDSHAAGDLDDETYQERRDLLTQRLMPLLDDEDAS